MKKHPLLIILFSALLLSACSGNRTTAHEDTAAKAPVVTPVAETVAPPAEKPKIKFYDPIVMEVDTDFGVQFAGQHFDVRPTSPALDKMLADYLKKCYDDHQRLPSKIVLHYPDEHTRIITEKGDRESIQLAQEVLRQYIPGADETANMVKYPILYQKKF